MLENTEGAIKKGQSRETGNIGYTRRRKTKQKHNMICVGHRHTQDEDKKKNTMQYVLDPTIYKQTQITYI
jgi:ribosome assembly protein YihI (activator of Der GTPase)